MAAIEDAALKKRGQYQSYPSSTRTKVVQAAMEGNPWRDVARALGVKMSTARSWVKSGRTACLPRGGKVVEPKRKISEEYGDFIFQVFRRSPTTTFAEVGRLLRRRFNLQIDPTNISRYMKKEEKFKEHDRTMYNREREGPFVIATDCVSSRTAEAEAAQQWNIASNVEEFDHCAAVA
ncbi:hypothetical protein FOZ62_004906 [Perkinsus olseni]|uniref:Uncharacterized protein n=1 Tax=Perkinsus olseni TaxID=32597 RepID=A0A7J6Q3I8_PEROL|nr:hypothetical protein FOZ62_004906 [Perkinsus olseni]